MNKLLYVLILIFFFSCSNFEKNKNNISIKLLEELVQCKSIDKIDEIARENSFSFKEKKKESIGDKYIYIKYVNSESKKFVTQLECTFVSDAGTIISYFFNSLAIPSQINFTRIQLKELGY